MKKLYEPTEQICILVEQNLQTHRTKYLYIQKNLMKQSLEEDQIFTQTEQSKMEKNYQGETNIY